MNKKSKRKNDLRSSIIFLVLLILLLLSATYAWFTANQVVTISTLDVHIEAQNGLQISTDATTWKSVITNADITDAAYNGNTNQVPSSMEPVSTVGEIDANTGNMKMYYGTVAADDTDAGQNKLSATLETDAEGATGKYIAFDLFLKAEKAVDLQLTNASGVVMKADSTDKGIKQASRVAFCVQGNKPSNTIDLTKITGLKGAVSFLEASKTVYMWEPNANLHTTEAAIHARDTYGINDLKTDGTQAKVPYYGIEKEIPVETGKDQGVLLKPSNDGTNTEYFKLVTPDYSTETDTTTGKMKAETQDVFSIAAGITKIRVYMWVEGQDVDCENNASGTDISFNVQLQVKPTTTE